MRRVVVTLWVVALLTGACTSPDSDTSPNAPSSTSSSGGAPESGGATETTTPTGTGGSTRTAGEVPPVPILRPAETIVEPGDAVVISADPRLAGTVTMTGPTGEAARAQMIGGEATLTVPDDADEGTYELQMSGDVSAFGVIAVTDGPGVWLTAPQYTMTGEQPEVLVTTYGIPTGMVTALEITAGDGTPDRLVPHPLLGLAPLTRATTQGLPEGASRWKLPAGFEGKVRVVAGRPSQIDIFWGDETDPPYASADHRIRACDQPGVISGDLGAPGGVKALWIAAGLESESTVTDDGPFSLEVRPGMVLVSAYRDAGETDASPLVLRVKCGETVDIGTGDTPVDTGPTPGSFLGGLTLDDLFAFTAESAGEITIGATGLAECDMSGGALGVWLNPQGSFEPRLYRLEVAGFDGTGRFEGTFTIEDVITGATSAGTVAVDAEVGAIEGIDAVGGAFRGETDGALGGGTFEVTFACALFGGLEAAAPHPVSQQAQVVSAIRLSDGGSTKPCRTGVALTDVAESESEAAVAAETIADDLTVLLTRSTERVSWTTSGDIRTLLSSEQQQQLLGSDEMGLIVALAEAVRADFLLTVSVKPFEGKWVASVRLLQTDPARLVDGVVITVDTLLEVPAALRSKWRTFKRALKRAAICGEVDEDQVSTTKGGQQTVSYQVTDLEGEPIDATVDEVASTCGNFSPETGRTAAYRVGDAPPALLPLHIVGSGSGRLAEAGTFTTTFTGEVPGCVDEVTFVARAQGPDGELTTERDAKQSTIAITIPMFEFKVTIDIETGSDTLHSESTGLFFIDPDFNQVIGAGAGSTHWEVPDFPCIVISESGIDERIQLFTGDGTYQVMPVGELASGDVRSSGTINFIPRGYLSNITVSYSDPDCFPQGTSTNDPFGTAVFSVTTFYPDILAGFPPDRGFEVSFTTDGSRTSRTWQFVETDGSVTIEVWSGGADGSA